MTSKSDISLANRGSTGSFRVCVRKYVRYLNSLALWNYEIQGARVYAWLGHQWIFIYQQNTWPEYVSDKKKKCFKWIIATI